MSEIRRFTKEDWYGWAGAENFKSGSEPFIYELELNDGAVELTAIADKNGLQVSLFCEDEEALGWYKEMILTAIKAEGELRALVKAIEEYTYAPDLSYAIDHELNPEFKGFTSYN